MNNNELQELIGSWFPNPEVTIASVVVEENQESSDLSTEKNVEKITAKEGINPSLLSFTEEDSEFLTILVKPEHLHSLMKQLKNNPKTQFDYLYCLTGMDWGKELGVVYHLESTVYRHQLVVKVNTEDRENPVFDSVCDIWKTAEFHEREVFDFFGIKFNNHPNLKYLFLTEEWEGYPLRKDYVDEVNMVIK